MEEKITPEEAISRLAYIMIKKQDRSLLESYSYEVMCERLSKDKKFLKKSLDIYGKHLMKYIDSEKKETDKKGVFWEEK